MKQPWTGREDDAPGATPSAPSSAPTAPTVKPTPRPVASAPPASAAPTAPANFARHCRSSWSRPGGEAGRCPERSAPLPPRPSGGPSSRPSAPGSGPAATPRPVSSPVSATPRPPQPSEPGDPASPSARPGPESSPPRGASLSSPPLGRPGASPSSSRPGGGPLSAHTPHRSSGARPGGPVPGGQHSSDVRPSHPHSQAPFGAGRRLWCRDFPTLEAERLHVFGGNPPTRAAIDLDAAVFLGPGTPYWRGTRGGKSSSRAPQRPAPPVAPRRCAAGPAAALRRSLPADEPSGRGQIAAS